MWEFLSGLDPFLQWCALWLAWPVLGTAHALLFKIPDRIMRTIRVCAKGWPPEHLDADGDWKPGTEN